MNERKQTTVSIHVIAYFCDSEHLLFSIAQQLQLVTRDLIRANSS